MAHIQIIKLKDVKIVVINVQDVKIIKIVNNVIIRNNIIYLMDIAI